MFILFRWRPNFWSRKASNGCPWRRQRTSADIIVVHEALESLRLLVAVPLHCGQLELLKACHGGRCFCVPTLLVGVFLGPMGLGFQVGLLGFPRRREAVDFVNDSLV